MGDDLILKARYRGGHGGGLPLDLIGHFIAPYLIRPKGEISMDSHRCNLCGKCQMLCRRHAIYINRKRRIWTIYPNRCDLCLNCVSHCPKKALDVSK